MSSLIYLKKPENKQKLNALLDLYEFYERIISDYLNEPDIQLYKDLNIFYMRDLAPTIRNLVNELRLDRDPIKLPKNYFPFKTLFESKKLLQRRRKNSENEKIDIFNVYSQIKTLVEQARAVMQPRTPEIKKVFKKVNFR